MHSVLDRQVKRLLGAKSADVVPDAQGLTEPIAVLGAGAFGVAVAHLLARAGETQNAGVARSTTRVRLWARRREMIQALQKTRHAVVLGKRTLHAGITPCVSLTTALSGVGGIVLAIPAQQLRIFWKEYGASIPQEMPLLLTSKGIEEPTGLLPSEVLLEVGCQNPMAFFAGPHLAHELVQDQPTIAVVAGPDASTNTAWQARLAHACLEVSTMSALGVAEFFSAFKNIVAVSSGWIMGRGLGENARSSLIVRGLEELIRLLPLLRLHVDEAQAGACGLQPALLADFMLTAYSMRSRNTAYGQSLASMADASRGQRASTVQPLAEGVPALRGLQVRLQRCGVTSAFCQTLASVMFTSPPRAS